MQAKSFLKQFFILDAADESAEERHFSLFQATALQPRRGPADLALCSRRRRRLPAALGLVLLQRPEVLA
jgi:hypothetical protein